MNKYFILNGEVKSTKEYDLSQIEKQAGVYEVIRVVNKTPLFAKEHIKRLFNSAKMLDLDLNMSQEKILENICKISNINNIKEKNVKLIFTVQGNSYIFFIKSFYPNEDMIVKGVDTIIYKVVRENPNIKFHNTALRSSINSALKEENAYEALLVDNKNRVVEGSRSNIFFIKEDSLVTAPSRAVLMGITREKVLEICKELEIDVIEKDIYVSELESYDGAFMTSTSNNVLPIRSIGDMIFNKYNGNLKKIMSEYTKKMKIDLERMEHCCKNLIKG